MHNIKDVHNPERHIILPHFEERAWVLKALIFIRFQNKICILKKIESTINRSLHFTGMNNMVRIHQKNCENILSFLWITGSLLKMWMLFLDSEWCKMHFTRGHSLHFKCRFSFNFMLHVVFVCTKINFHPIWYSWIIF